MASRSTAVTAEQMLAMPDAGNSHELVRGEVRNVSPAGFRASAIGARLTALLDAHVRARGLGTVTGADGGYVVTRDPDTVYGPDTAFVRVERLLQHGAVIGFFPGPPDLAAEVLSPRDSWSEVMAKVEDYLEAGTRMILVVDPGRRRVSVFQPRAPMLVLDEGDTLDGGDVVPGWLLSLAELFDLGPAAPVDLPSR